MSTSRNRITIDGNEAAASVPDHLTNLRRDLAFWLEDHEYESLEQMKGSMNLLRCPNPAARERSNYMSVLQSWWG